MKKIVYSILGVIAAILIYLLIFNEPLFDKVMGIVTHKVSKVNTSTKGIRENVKDISKDVKELSPLVKSERKKSTRDTTTTKEKQQ